jgi:hypothetical protein
VRFRTCYATIFNAGTARQDLTEMIFEFFWSTEMLVDKRLRANKGRSHSHFDSLLTN